jgi:peptidoglycan/xylan/chitin deacetylase (PgdA/CDA1 family)
MSESILPRSLASLIGLGLVYGCIGKESTGVHASGAQSSGPALGDQGAPVKAERLPLSPCGLPELGGAAIPKPSGKAGNLAILNWAGFKGAVSYTFDDANSSQVANYSSLNDLGVRMTFYLVTNKPEASDRAWQQALKDGHELGNHTVSHRRIGSPAEIDGATAFFQKEFGQRPWTMAAPYGDATYSALAASRFLVNRGVGNGLIMPNDASNPFNLPCYVPPQGATAANDFNPQIDSAERAGGWRVVLVHGFKGGHDSAYQPVSLDEFVIGVQHARSLGDLWIDSVVNVGAYWRAQKMFSAVSPTTAGDEITWKWTLPANFPPGKCLRATVDGGTLSQFGATLPWNGHGYYEVSLDAGSLTLAP